MTINFQEAFKIIPFNHPCIFSQFNGDFNPHIFIKLQDDILLEIIEKEMTYEFRCGAHLVNDNILIGCLYLYIEQLSCIYNILIDCCLISDQRILTSIKTSRYIRIILFNGNIFSKNTKSFSIENQMKNFPKYLYSTFRHHKLKKWERENFLQSFKLLSKEVDLTKRWELVGEGIRQLN